MTDAHGKTGAYWRWRCEIPAELEDVLSAELWDLGTLGVESDLQPNGEGRLGLTAYFDDPLPAALGEFDNDPWRSRGLHVASRSRHGVEDWLANYREAAQLLDIGRRFRVDPGEIDPKGAEPHSPQPVPDGRILLRIPARTAFGTGSHESTRLALEWLESIDLHGRAMLDVGCGSGILCFAAEALGAGPVIGYDLDPEAVLMARTYARLNGYAPGLFAGRPSAFERPNGTAPRFDLLVVNVLPERIREDYPTVLRSLRPGGHVISSGNLVEQRDDLLGRFGAWGLESVGEKVENEWVAFLLRKA